MTTTQPESSTKSQALFNSADAFHRSASLLYEKTDGECGGIYIVPSYVLFAFSLELYLKYIISLNSGRAVRGHDLLELFKSIGLSNKERLKQLYADSVRNGLGKRQHFKSVLEDHGAVMPNPEDLEAVLRASKDAFAQLRYIHEAGERSGPRFLAGAALSAIRKLIFELDESLVETYAP